MKDHDVNVLLEAYRDGTLKNQDAKRLAEILKQDNEETALFMEELTFSRLLSEAMSDTGSKRFVKSLLERLSAENEESKVDFSTSFRKRLKEVEAERAGQSRQWWHSFLPAGTDAGTDAKRVVLSTPAKAVLCVVLLAMVASAAFVLFGGGSPTVGTLGQASSGVIIYRDGEASMAKTHMTLSAGDVVQVPSIGTAQILLGKQVVIELTAKSRMIVHGLTHSPTVSVESGELSLSRLGKNDDKPVAIGTPHGDVELTRAVMSLGVSRSSSVIEVEEGSVSVKGRSDQARRRLTKDQSAVLTP